MKLNLFIKNPGRYPIRRERLFGVVEATLLAFSQSPFGRERQMDRVVVSILITNKKQMAEYNLKYHETEGPTDVLSFPYTDPQSQVSDEQFIDPPGTGVILGDLIVCYPVAREVGIKEGKTTEAMLDFYVDHGLHHLLGIHHD